MQLLQPLLCSFLPTDLMHPKQGTDAVTRSLCLRHTRQGVKRRGWTVRLQLRSQGCSLLSYGKTWIPSQARILILQLQQTHSQPAVSKQPRPINLSQISLVLKVYAKLNIIIDSWDGKKEVHTRHLAHICLKVVILVSAFIN